MRKNFRKIIDAGEGMDIVWTLASGRMSGGPGRHQPMEARMLVKNVMRRDAQWIGPDATVKDIALKMRDLDIGSLPVGENGKSVV